MKRTIRKAQGSTGPYVHLTWLLVLVLSAVFVLTLAGIAVSSGGIPGGDREMRGEVIAVDHGHSLGTVTVESPGIGQFPNNSINIFTNSDTKASMCGRAEPVKDIAVDRTATVIYREVGGVPLADRIAERC